MSEVLQKDPSHAGDFLVDSSATQWEPMENNNERMSLFRKTKRYLEKADTDEAIRSLTNIINLPGLESWQYKEAYHFLNKLFAFSEKYFDLYGIDYEYNN